MGTLWVLIMLLMANNGHTQIRAQLLGWREAQTRELEELKIYEAFPVCRVTGCISGTYRIFHLY